ncbi:uncharacterized protein LOC141532965 [Cotesia typhae]|uniref:uncharacterized protein LOC141532965 n=1 Tax=Cotesia typhae TaxID=2053667 RepID=UPI003D68A450
MEFFATAHGKGPCDGVGGTVKIRASRASLQLPPDEQILTPVQFFEWVSKNLTNINVRFSTVDAYNLIKDKLEDRFKNAKTIPATQKIHKISPLEDDVIDTNKENSPEEFNKNSEESTTTDKLADDPEAEVPTTPKNNAQEADDESSDWNKEFLELMGEESTPTGPTTKVDDTIEKQWTNWMAKGLTDEARKELLKKYSRVDKFRTEAPKVNLEIITHLSEISKKRDQHFADTQNCVGTALVSLGSAISMLMENPEDGVDQVQLMKYIWDAGKIRADVFHQHSTARKSFITPNLDKDIKSTLEATVPTNGFMSGKLERPTWESQTGGLLPETAVHEREIQTETISDKAIPDFTSLDDANIESIDVEEVEKVSFIAGRLRHFVEEWKTITSDKFILNCLRGYNLTFKSKPVQFREPSTPNWSLDEFEKINQEISNLLTKKAIEKCVACEGQFVSSYFLVAKPDKSNRFIINLGRLNEFIETTHFKMEDLRAVKNLISQGSYMATLDLKDAYFLVPVNERDRKYLRFRFNNILYQFTCLPFGLSTSPYIFTKIMKPVVNVLRLKGWLSVIYLDDLLCICNSYESCSSNVKNIIKLLEKLGFIINYKKSCTRPSTRCKYLGFIVDSEKYSVDLPDNKKNQILQFLNHFEVGKKYKIRFFAQLIGTLVAASPAVEYSKIYIVRLEREKWLALTINDNNFEAYIKITNSIMEDLIWWKINLLTGSNPIRTQNYKITISSDASRSGWGAESNLEVTHGFWSQKDKKFHINYLELLAAFFALKCFASNLSNCEILMRID